LRRVGVRVRTTGRLTDLDVRVAASLRAHPRIGLIVPRYKHSAVERNRLKRRLRELLRTRLLPALPPLDLVVRALPTAYRADFAALATQLDAVRAAVAS
jgi:ribonuclease P protein component